MNYPVFASLPFALLFPWFAACEAEALRVPFEIHKYESCRPDGERKVAGEVCTKAFEGTHLHCPKEATCMDNCGFGKIWCEGNCTAHQEKLGCGKHSSCLRKKNVNDRRRQADNIYIELHCICDPGYHWADEECLPVEREVPRLECTNAFKGITFKGLNSGETDCPEGATCMRNFRRGIFWCDGKCTANEIADANCVEHSTCHKRIMKWRDEKNWDMIKGNVNVYCTCDTGFERGVDGKCYPNDKVKVDQQDCTKAFQGTDLDCPKEATCTKNFISGKIWCEEKCTDKDREDGNCDAFLSCHKRKSKSVTDRNAFKEIDCIEVPSKAHQDTAFKFNFEGVNKHHS